MKEEKFRLIAFGARDATHGRHVELEAFYAKASKAREIALRWVSENPKWVVDIRHETYDLYIHRIVESKYVGQARMTKKGPVIFPYAE